MATGPLGPTGPTTDPNWAWDVPGWTNQAKTGDVEGAQLAGQSNLGSNVLIEPAALSGYLARTLDPDVSASGAYTSAITAGTTLYGALLQTYDPIVTSYVCFTATAGSTTSQTHAWIALLNPGTGYVYAATADAGTATIAATGFAKIAWSAATVLAPQQYLVVYGQVGTWSTEPKFGGIATLSTEAQGLLAPTQTSTGPITPYDRFAVYSALTAYTVPPTIGAVMPGWATSTVTPSASGVFFGLI